MRLSEKFVVTINRELGSGGRTVGEKLAAKLGVPFYDKVQIKALVDKYGLSVDEIERLKGKKRSWWPDFKRLVELDGGFAVSIYSSAPDISVPDKPDSEKIFQTEKEVLKGIADVESCVIAGRCGFCAFKEYPNHLNVLIQAPMEQRIERVMKKKGLSAKDAKKVIDHVDELRENYVTQNAGTSRYDSRNYDLVISMNGKTEDEAVDLILKYIG